MTTLLIVSLLLNGMVLGLLVVFSIPYNKRALAAWLISSAKADEELRQARKGIYQEARAEESRLRQELGLRGLPTLSKLRELD